MKEYRSGPDRSGRGSRGPALRTKIIKKNYQEKCLVAKIYAITLVALALVGLLGVDASVSAAVILNPGALVDTAVKRLV